MYKDNIKAAIIGSAGSDSQPKSQATAARRRQWQRLLKCFVRSVSPGAA